MRGKLQTGLISSPMTCTIESSLTETPNLWVRSCLRGSINLFISVTTSPFNTNGRCFYTGGEEGARRSKVWLKEVAYGSFVSEPVNTEDPFAVVNSSHVIGCVALIREPKES